MPIDPANEAFILKLLEDSDNQAVTQVLASLLEDREEAQSFISRHQDDDSPLVRRHLQVLSSILRMEERRNDFISAAQNGHSPLWDNLLRLSLTLDPAWSLDYLNALYASYRDEFLAGISADETLTTSRIVQQLRQSKIEPASLGNSFHVESHLLPFVLDHTSEPQQLLQCALLQHLGLERGWRSSIVVGNGCCLLLAGEGVGLVPTENWVIMPPHQMPQVRRCTDRELTALFLSQLYTASVVEHHLESIYVTSHLLAQWHHCNVQEFAFPIGDIRS